MTNRPRTIVALGGGGFSMGDDPCLDRWLLSLTRKAEPRVCFVPTASGDSAEYIERFYAAFERLPCRPDHLSLFRRTQRDPDGFLRAQDLIYVGGGNTANMLAVWRVHGVDRALAHALDAGVVLCGLSAGSLCWFEGGTTDSFGPELAPLVDGLGFLAGSHCPHYDGEPTRRPRYQTWVGRGDLPAGIAIDDGVAVCFRDGEAVEIVASSRTGGAYAVRPTDAGVEETPLPLPIRRLELMGEWIDDDEQ